MFLKNNTHHRVCFMKKYAKNTDLTDRLPTPPFVRVNLTSRPIFTSNLFKPSFSFPTATEAGAPHSFARRAWVPVTSPAPAPTQTPYLAAVSTWPTLPFSQTSLLATLGHREPTQSCFHDAFISNSPIILISNNYFPSWFSYFTIIIQLRKFNRATARR